MNLKKSIELSYIIRDETVLKKYELEYAERNGIKDQLKTKFPHAWDDINFFSDASENP